MKAVPASGAPSGMLGETGHVVCSWPGPCVGRPFCVWKVWMCCVSFFYLA